jgi:hypothetical protein
MEKSPLEIKIRIINDLKNVPVFLNGSLATEPYCSYAYGLLSFLNKKKNLDLEYVIKQYVTYLEIENAPVLKIDDAILFFKKKIF